MEHLAVGEAVAVAGEGMLGIGLVDRVSPVLLKRLHPRGKVLDRAVHQHQPLAGARGGDVEEALLFGRLVPRVLLAGEDRRGVATRASRACAPR